MYPNDNQNTQPISPDYLNQIAPQSTSGNGLFNQKPILIAIAGLFVVLIIFFVSLIASSSSSGTDNLARLSKRLNSVESTAISAIPNIKNTKLRALNSNLKIYLTNINRDISPLLISEKIDVKKINKKIIAEESNTKTLSTLEDARLNAVYDRTYAREMSYKLETTMSLMTQIYKTTKSKKLKIFLDESYKNLEPIKKQFADFNAING